MSKFKVGDIVEVIHPNWPIKIGEIVKSSFGHYGRGNNLIIDRIWLIKSLSTEDITRWYNQYDIKLTTKNNNMNIKEKFVLALTPEPQKSFRKAGITDGDDILTEDGKSIFLSWLLNTKYAEEFKKEIVDNMKEDKCCK